MEDGSNAIVTLQLPAHSAYPYPFTAPSQSGLQGLPITTGIFVTPSNANVSGLVFWHTGNVPATPSDFLGLGLGAGLVLNGVNADVDIDTATTGETDTSKRLAPNGTGGVSWGAGGIGVDGWVTAGATLTYTSADAPTFVAGTSGDLTGAISVGMRLKLTQTTVKYFIVTAIDASTITLYGGTDYTLANAAITSPAYSPVKAPLGFPLDPAKWSVQVVDSTPSAQQASPTVGTWYNMDGLSGAVLSITIPIGAWYVSWQATIAGNSSAGSFDFLVALSASTNSSSDLDLQAAYNGDTTVNVPLVGVGRSKLLSLSAKQKYQIVMQVGGADNTPDFIAIEGANDSDTILRAVSAYL